MSDYGNVIQGMFGSDPQTNVTANINADPDAAARSIELSRASGVPAPIINTDVDTFEGNQKAAMASSLVSNNAYIADYVQSHPLASTISNDDYGNLDNVSQKLEAIRKYTAPWNPTAPSDPLKHFTDAGPIGSWIPEEDRKDHPIASAIAAGLATPIEVALRGIGGVFGAATDIIKESSTQVGGESFGREMGALADAEFMGLTGRGHMGEVPEALGKAAPFLRNGEVPPAGLHPEIDAFKLERNQSALDELADITKEAQSSTTKERAPELFQGFVQQHVGNTSMGISGQRVLEMYGDKIPTADDGLLGWVPNIAQQLEVAKDTGADVSIPMADWITRIDPKLAKDLHDDLRVVPEGITNREAEDLKATPPLPAVDETVPLIRQSAGYEPLFSVGDRKLSLQRLAPEGEVNPAFKDFHDFDLQNENGQSVGTINLSSQKGGKELYIEMINGLGEYYNPNKFGPALMRDLLKQIKQEFPEAETITGHRVTGARDKVGDISGPAAMPRIKLSDIASDMSGNHEKFSQLLGGAWATIHDQSGLQAYIKPSELWTEHEHDIASAVNEEMSRIVPDLQHSAVSEFNQPKAKLQTQAAYLRYRDHAPIAVWALNGEDALGNMRHEAIHHLYRQGFFKPEEWTTLRKAAHDEDWLGRFDIHKRYDGLDENGKFEESIADAYKSWTEEHETRQRLADYQATPVDRIFQKLKDFFDSFRQRLGEILGREPTFEDLFRQVHEGEIGSREPSAPDAGFGIARSDIEDTGLNPPMPFRAAKDVGMNVDQYRRYSKLIEERQQADLKKSSDRVLREQTKRQSQEWKDQSEAMRPKVVEDINSRPDVAADKFFGLGELFGEKLDKTYKLDWDSLTPEQRATLPEKYTVRRGGIKADDVASIFGYHSGDQMLAHLTQFTKGRELSGMNRDKYQRSLVQAEIARRMEMEHGFLEKNILEESKDQILSENQLDLLHEETHALALMSGDQGFNLTRDQLGAQAKAKYDQLLVGQVKSDNFLREAGKHGKAAEMALLQEKPADAFKAKQAQYYNSIYADFARKTEKDLARLNRTAKQFKKSDVKGVEPEYLNHIQNLLQEAGFKIGRSLENIEENLTRRGKTLEQFANEKLSESFGYRDIPIADFILEGKVKPIDQMTTYELGGYKQTVDALVKNGKDEQKIIRAGEAADRADVLADMKTHIERFDLKPINATPTRWDKIKEVPKAFIAGLTNMETFLNRMGDRDPHSVFNKYVTYPAAAAANRKSSLQREYSKLYRDIGEVAEKDKLVQSPLVDPLTGKPFANFTRGQVAQMIQNAGNESNWQVLAKGYGADPAMLKEWLVKNSTKADWDRAQQLGKSVFGELIKLADQEYEHLHGITIDKIPLQTFTNAHGTFEGWYHPLVRDPLREGKSPLREGAYDDGDFGHITTSNGYTRKRTGSAYPVDLNPNMTPVRIGQMIHDISFRSFVLETQKIFKDSSLSNTITARYGAEYNGRNFLMPWLKSIAGQESVPSRAAAMAGNLSEFFRQNVIGTYIGFNPFTALKHGPTAWVMSARQVGTGNFLRATQDLYAKSPSLTKENHEFAMKWSEELQRRERHWQDTLFGAHSEIEGASSLREKVIEKGSWLVAQSDMLSAKPTWLAAYRNAQEEGLTHGEAIDLADAAVRQAHGSTAVTNQPALVRGGGPVHNWLTSVYGFFGTAMQRRIELAQDINDSYKLVKQGELTKASSNIPSILADTFTYVIWPTIVEEWVSGLTTDDHRGLLEHVATGALLGLSSSVLYARDIVNGLISGHDVGVGLISSPLHDLVKGVKAPFKKDAFSRQRAGKTIGDTLAALGHGTGMAPKTIDNAIHFGIDLVNQTAHPKTAGDWARGLLKGETKAREHK